MRNVLRKWIPGGWILALGILLVAGCGGSGRKPVFTVRGKVLTADKKPAAGALVTFHPVAAAPKDTERPSGHVDEQGNYQLTTYLENDGAPAGDYAVTIVWPVPRKTPFEPEGPDRLGGKFARPETSPHMFTVKPRPDQDLPAITLP